MEVWQTSNLRPLRLGEEKRKKKKEETTGQKYYGLPYCIGQTIKNDDNDDDDDELAADTLLHH